MDLRPKDLPSLDITILLRRGQVTIDVGSLTDSGPLCRDDVLHTMAMVTLAPLSMDIVVVLFDVRHSRVGSSKQTKMRTCI
jgi:hypothetical protein